MPTVTGLTAARLIELEDATVIGGHIDVSGHLILEQHDGGEIDAGDALVAVPSASETQEGAVELATSAETITGTDAVRAVTPAGLQAKVASETAKGIVELATVAEVTTGTDTERAVTPAGLAAQSINRLADVTITAAAEGHILQHDGTDWKNKSSVDLVFSSASTDALTTKVTGDTQKRYILNADGKQEWGPGNDVTDTNLFRAGEDWLKTDDFFTSVMGIDTVRFDATPASGGDNVFVSTVTGDAEGSFYIGARGEQSWGDGTDPTDVSISRSGIGSLEIDGSLNVTGDQGIEGDLTLDGGLDASGKGSSNARSKTSDQTNNTATYTADNHISGASVCPVQANRTYGFMLCGSLLSNATADFKIRLSGPSGFAAGGCGRSRLDGSTADLNFATGVVINCDAASLDFQYFGWITTSSTPGNIGVEFAQNTANAGPTSLRDGTILVVFGA